MRLDRCRALLVPALVLGACSSASTPSPEPAQDLGYITRAEYGDDWPFLVDAGTLSCVPSGNDDGRLIVTFDTGDGIEYALNGQAKDFGFPELDATILADYPDQTGTLDLIDRGLELCE